MMRNLQPKANDKNIHNATKTKIATDQYPPAPSDFLICSKLSQNVSDHGAIRIQHGMKPKMSFKLVEGAEESTQTCLCRAPRILPC